MSIQIVILILSDSEAALEQNCWTDTLMSTTTANMCLFLNDRWSVQTDHLLIRGQICFNSYINTENRLTTLCHEQSHYRLVLFYLHIHVNRAIRESLWTRTLKKEKKKENMSYRLALQIHVSKLAYAKSLLVLCWLKLM